MNFDSFVLATPTNELSVEPAAREAADTLEFRLDLADDPLAQLSTYDGELPIIVTNRVEWEGGGAADNSERLDILTSAFEHDSVEAVDIELRALDGSAVSSQDASWVVRHAREQSVQIIASVHDFETTPSGDELDTLLGDACTHGDVGKLAVTAVEPGDVLRLLGATWSHANRGETVATMAMGSAGRHSRAVCPLYGSRIGYAPIKPEDATAPGQYDLATLRSLIDELAGSSRTKKI